MTAGHLLRQRAQRLRLYRVGVDADRRNTKLLAQGLEHGFRRHEAKLHQNVAEAVARFRLPRDRNLELLLGQQSTIAEQCAQRGDAGLAAGGMRTPALTGIAPDGTCRSAARLSLAGRS